MDYETAKRLIREKRTRTGVYEVLETFGVDTGLPLCRTAKQARDYCRWREMEVIQCAQMRLIQIENHEV